MSLKHILLFGFLTIISSVVVYLGVRFKWNNNATSQTNKCSNCNVLLIDLDILRADALPCYGYHRNTAPNICSFAEKSIVFKNNYSNSSFTLPSMFSTITSLYPTFHRVRSPFLDVLDPETPTLAETLQRKGYRTFFVTDPGINDAILTSDNGGLRGYDQLIVNQSITEVIANLSNESKPWFVHYYNSDLHMPYLLPEGVEPMENLVAPKDLPITSTEFNLRLNKYLKSRVSEVFQDRAIDEYSSIFVSSTDPDDTSVAKLFFKLLGTNPKEYLHDGWTPIFNTYLQSFDTQSTTDAGYVRMLYDTKINFVDSMLKKLLDLLETKELANKTVTIITSDHGEAFGEHGTFSHQESIHTELFYTPLIVRIPNSTPMEVEYTSSGMDIFPTILDLTDIKPPSGLQGVSLVPFTDSQNVSSNRFILSEVLGGAGILAQNNEWLYFLPSTASKMEQSVLYHKTTDPKETYDVSKSYPSITRQLYQMTELLRSYDISYLKRKILPIYNDLKLDPQKVKRLQKEGYF